MTFDRLLAEAQSDENVLGVVVFGSRGKGAYVTPESDCPCDRSMRGYELEALAALGSVVTIERRDEPVVALDELARLVPLDSAR